MMAPTPKPLTIAIQSIKRARSGARSAPESEM
jgi:hypothetical protein